METTKLGRPTWPAYDTNAVLYRISHSYLLVIDDLEWKDGDTSTPCVEAYLMVDGGLSDEITGMVLKKAVRLTESMAGQSMLDLFLCQEKERDEFNGHISPFWEVNNVRCETLSSYDPAHPGEIEQFFGYGHLESCYNEYEDRFEGNILNDLGRAIQDMGVAETFLRRHHHLPRITNRCSKEAAAKRSRPLSWAPYPFADGGTRTRRQIGSIVGKWTRSCVTHGRTTTSPCPWFRSNGPKSPEANASGCTITAGLWLGWSITITILASYAQGKKCTRSRL